MGMNLQYDTEKAAKGAPRANMNITDQTTKNKNSTKKSTASSANFLTGLAALTKLLGDPSGNSNISSKTPSIISQASNNGVNTVWANTGSTWKNALANIGQFLGITKNVEDTIPVNFMDDFNKTTGALRSSGGLANLSDIQRDVVNKNIMSQYDVNTGAFTGGW